MKARLDRQHGNVLPSRIEKHGGKRSVALPAPGYIDAILAEACQCRCDEVRRTEGRNGLNEGSAINRHRVH